MGQSDFLPDVVFTGNDEIIVDQRYLDGPLGKLDLTGDYGFILIEKNQPKVGKHIILLHEMIHLCAESMKSKGIISRQPAEKFVENLAGCLLPMMVYSGLWNGVSASEVTEFLGNQDAGH